MRICVLTFHRAYSYGACLQAYSTWKYLESLGVDCKFISYENDYEARMRNGRWKKYENFLTKGKIRVKKIFYKYDLCCNKAYSNFHGIFPIIEMNEINKDDILAIGSDQIWNPDICGGMDDIFFLNGYCNKKISLSTSAGSHCFDEKESEMLKKWLSDYLFISVREQKLSDQLKNKCSIESQVILDPTFWLNKTKWLKLIENKYFKPHQSYILVFVFDNTSTSETEQIIINYKKKLGLPVYQIMHNTYKKKYCDKVIAGANPFEFVGLINDADFVITNSFHGVAFSINMNTPFSFIPVNNSNNDRMSELLIKVQLEDRKVEDFLKLAPTKMSFEKANALLEKERRKSQEWIKNVLGRVDYEYFR